ncbi:UBX domain-containing protein 8 isoform X1 [Prionailurus iriomotensis]
MKKGKNLSGKNNKRHRVKSVSRYIEDVLKPHQEMKLRKLEERFYQMTGETWKLSNGHKLGGDEELVLENGSQTSFETSNSREAAKRRNLPKPLTKISPSAEQPTQKEVLDLPEEPPETADEVVAVALRCPSGRVLKRRFFKSCSSQGLISLDDENRVPHISIQPFYFLSQKASGSRGRLVPAGHWNNYGYCTQCGRKRPEQLIKK